MLGYKYTICKAEREKERHTSTESSDVKRCIMQNDELNHNYKYFKNISICVYVCVLEVARLLIVFCRL